MAGDRWLLGVGGLVEVEVVLRRIGLVPVICHGPQACGLSGYFRSEAVVRSERMYCYYQLLFPSGKLFLEVRCNSRSTPLIGPRVDPRWRQGCPLSPPATPPSSHPPPRHLHRQLQQQQQQQQLYDFRRMGNHRHHQWRVRLTSMSAPAHLLMPSTSIHRSNHHFQLIVN